MTDFELFLRGAVATYAINEITKNIAVGITTNVMIVSRALSAGPGIVPSS